MAQKKKIAFVTLARSDFSTTEPIFNNITSYKSIDSSLIVGGSHLLKRFGNSIKSINLKPSKIIKFMDENDNSSHEISKSYVRAIVNFTKYFKKEKFDAIFLVGDRWEMHAVASSAFMLRIPIIHHSGGDITQGSSDNQIRYSITNLSSFHFTATEEHKRRLIRIGEDRSRILVTGEPALEKLHNLVKESKNVSRNHIIATYHPCTFEKISILDQAKVFFDSILKIRDKILLTAPNPDHFSKEIYDFFKRSSRDHEHITFIENLGENYYKYLLSAKCLVGNSSSGIWEAQTSKTPVVNIGPRQEGRTKSFNVIDVNINQKEILRAIKKATSKNFNEKISKLKNPYYKKNSSEIISSNILKVLNKKDLLRKRINL